MLLLGPITSPGHLKPALVSEATGDGDDVTCELLKQKSKKSQCVRGSSFDCVSKDGGVEMWANHGCRGYFACGARQVGCGHGAPWGTAKCKCGTARRRPPQTCQVEVVQQQSHKECKRGETYDCYADGRAMWVNKGCRGRFRCSGTELLCGKFNFPFANCTCLWDSLEGERLDTFTYPSVEATVSVLRAAANQTRARPTMRWLGAIISTDAFGRRSRTAASSATSAGFDVQHVPAVAPR